MTLRARDEAREARYAKLVRAAFAARGNHSHLPAENRLPTETYRGRVRQLSWWRTWHDRTGSSLPRLVGEATRRWRRRAAADHADWVRERLAERYAAETDLRSRLGLPTPPSGRPKRPGRREPVSVRGLRLTDYPDLLAEWAWDVNADRDPARLAAGSHERVTRASAREVVWRCQAGHEWSAPVYQRTLSGSGCPDCHRLDAVARSRVGKERARRVRDTAALATVVALHQLETPDDEAV